jgi:ATP-dependent DNA helicase RecQ
VISLASESTGWLDPADRNRWQFFQRQSQQQRDRARQLLKKLPPTADIRQLKSDPDAEIALALLQQQGQLTWEDPFHFRLLSQAAPPPRSSGADPLDIRIYLRSRACRWRSILTGFGFLEEAQGLTCGQCDRCQRR